MFHSVYFSQDVHCSYKLLVLYVYSLCFYTQIDSGSLSRKNPAYNLEVLQLIIITTGENTNEGVVIIDSMFPTCYYSMQFI
jgi:hypothetical protein